MMLMMVSRMLDIFLTLTLNVIKDITTAINFISHIFKLSFTENGII